MKLLIIAERFLPQRGGLAASTARIAKGLAARGVKVHLFNITSELEPSDLESGSWDDIVVHRFGQFKKFDRTYMVACRAIELLHRRHPFDAFMGMYLVHAGYLAATQGRLLEVPSLVMARGNDVDRELWRSDRLPFLIKTLEWATAVGCVSKELTDKCRALGNRDDVHWTPNSVDADVFTPADADPELKLSLGLGKGPVVGFSGELRFKKGLHHVVEAARRLSESIPGVHFLLVGGVRGDDRDEYDALLKDDDELAQILVEAPYEKDQQKLADYYRLMDVLFLPSLWEGMPNAALEAMACGVPVVAGEIGGLKDLIEPGKTGYLFPPGDLESALEVLPTALAMPGDIRRDMSARARKKVTTEFTLDKEIDRIMYTLDRIHNNASKPDNR